MEFTLETRGIQEAIKILQSLKKDVTRLDFERSAEKGLENVRRAAIANVRAVTRRRTGRLQDAIVIKRMDARVRRRYGYFAGSYVGVDYKKAPHGHLIEYGTGPRFRTTKSGVKSRTGTHKATPFLRPAYQENRELIFRDARSELGDRIQRKINRAVRANRARV